MLTTFLVWVLGLAQQMSPWHEVALRWVNRDIRNTFCMRYALILLESVNRIPHKKHELPLAQDCQWAGGGVEQRQPHRFSTVSDFLFLESALVWSVFLWRDKPGAVCSTILLTPLSRYYSSWFKQPCHRSEFPKLASETSTIAFYGTFKQLNFHFCDWLKTKIKCGLFYPNAYFL